MHFDNTVWLHWNWGWVSGGFIGDSKFDATLSYGSGQQFYNRNSQVALSSGGVWNVAEQGVTIGSRDQAEFNDGGPRTTLGGPTKMREASTSSPKWRRLKPAIASRTSWMPSAAE